MLFADPLLARRIEGAETAAALEVVETSRHTDPDGGAAALAVAGGCAVFLAPSMPVNRAVGLGMGRAVADSEIAAVEAFYRDRGLDPAIDLCPLADRSLVDALGPRGYAVGRVLNTHVRAVAPAEPAPQVPGVTVAESTPADAESWASTVARGFFGRDALPADLPALRLARLTMQRPSVRGLLAYVDGTPAGAVALAVRDGLGLVFSASTREEFRNRGVNRALLGAALAAASAAGCDIACVATAPGGTSERTVRALGFRHAYTRMLMVREWS
ncbi:GNAT family N-acetyltransferase [Azospirillum sp.]|uniref:GNAT family N-acetyltransferase n=1 Tax=Azospirillum sp. TaxID=34012 RepID=UPI002D2F25CB|nr:GNAT family N-acetyltransferase [Azospirillum sp.]HYD67766.1 GNAT family N-acetyltransferase [Azospirillum sp.]